MTPYSNTVRLLLDKPSQQTAFSLATGNQGFFRRIGATNANGNHVPIPITAGMSASINFFGQGADNATAAYRVWLGDATPKQSDDRTKYDGAAGDFFELAGTGVLTLSTLTPDSADRLIRPHPDLSVGTAGQELRWVDTLTWAVASAATTPQGPQSDIEGGFQEGSAIAYNPGGIAANLAPAKLVLPALGRASLMIVEFDMTGALAMNGLVRITRP